MQQAIKFKHSSNFFQRHFSFYELVLYCFVLSPKKEEDDFSGLQNTIIIISLEQHKSIDIASSNDTSVADYTA